MPASNKLRSLIKAGASAKFRNINAGSPTYMYMYAGGMVHYAVDVHEVVDFVTSKRRVYIQ